MANPSPRLPPVTRATLPSSRNRSSGAAGWAGAAVAQQAWCMDVAVVKTAAALAVRVMRREAARNNIYDDGDILGVITPRICRHLVLSTPSSLGQAPPQL